MLIVVMAAATALTAAWLILLNQASREDWVAAAYNQVLKNRLQEEKLRRQERERRRKLEEYRGPARKVMGLFYGGSTEKKRRRLAQDSQRLQSGNLKSVSLLVLPGYVLQRRFPRIGQGSLHKRLLEGYAELLGRKYAPNRARALLAQLLSYPILGLACALCLGAILMGTGNRTGGLAALAIGSAIVLVLTYSLYDELFDSVRRRREAISRQFPNVVSKLALLVTSGMIMDRAWKETAESQDSELYQEMRRTAEELDNLVAPELAYTNFINRCSTKETTKLASAIIQNQTKGNAEIGRLLKEMAREAWQERRNMAKRDSEHANSRLMIPTMLLFLAILVMLMVPVAINFTSI